VREAHPGGHVGVSVESASAWVRAWADAIATNKQALTKLDSAIGDGDHGTNMDRGMKAAVEKLAGSAATDVGTVFKTVGMALVSKVGGAGGPLYGSLFMQMGSAAGGESELSPEAFATAFEAGVNGVVARGKAARGDKTMLDALLPAAEALKEAVGQGTSWPDALRRAEEAAREGMEATIPLVARKGRASYLGERSAGHQDPGATSSHLLVECATETLAKGSS
jgi:phosphoenolpyruvate---glycerone phosphotransferase subunit DhaL